MKKFPYKLLFLSHRSFLKNGLLITAFLFYVFFLLNSYQSLSFTTKLSIVLLFGPFVLLQTIHHVIFFEKTKGIIETFFGNINSLLYYIQSRFLSFFLQLVFPLVMFSILIVYDGFNVIHVLYLCGILCIFYASFILIGMFFSLLGLSSFLVYLLCLPIKIPYMLWLVKMIENCLFQESFGICFAYFFLGSGIIFLCESIIKEKNTI